MSDVVTTRDGEPFTATVDCPGCGHMAVHWLSEPRLRPEVETPVEKLNRRMHAGLYGLSSRTVTNPRWYDPDGTTVARKCVKCAYRWGQR